MLFVGTETRSARANLSSVLRTHPVVTENNTVPRCAARLPVDTATFSHCRRAPFLCGPRKINGTSKPSSDRPHCDRASQRTAQAPTGRRAWRPALQGRSRSAPCARCVLQPRGGAELELKRGRGSGGGAWVPPRGLPRAARSAMLCAVCDNPQKRTRTGTAATARVNNS